MASRRFKFIILLLFLLALLVRLIYVIKIPYTEKQHDVEPQGNGLSYIFELYEKGSLPQDNEDQHYHPPFHPIISAMWLKGVSIFTNQRMLLCESLQFLTVIYSMILLFIVYQIVKALKLKKKLQILILAVMAFHPSWIILAGSINNDMLSLTLIISAYYGLIKWYQKANIRNVIILAILTGLCVMTKTSGAIIAVPILYVFLFKLYKEGRKNLKKYISMFLIFGMISLPIGLWYPIRNYVRFEQPILYVRDPENMNLYVGDNTWIERVTPISAEITKMYANPWEDCNIPIFLLKCSLFGEYTWETNGIWKILYFIAIITNCLLVIETFINIGKSIAVKDKRNKVWINSCFLLFVFNIFSYLIMNRKLPYGCSMDFRYIASTIFLGVMLISFSLDYVRRNNKKQFHLKYEHIGILTFVLFFTSDIIILCS